jgi:hypothetical protein
MLSMLDTPQQVSVDSLRVQDAGTAYDSVWANAIPEYEPTGFEELMLSEDKIFVVLAVVLLIWIGISYFLIRTDRKIADLERAIDARVPEDDDEL